MEERVVSCNAGSDEVPTDVSSSPSRNHNRNTSLEPTSTPTKELRDEADQQILQWASKLELESIELRERSSALMHNLSQRYDSLSHAAARFGEIEKKLKQNMTAMLQECRESIVKEAGEAVRAAAPVAAEPSLDVSVLTSQMEDIRCLLVNVSRDMSRLHSRQGSLERQVERLREGQVERLREAQFNGTTLQEAIPSRVTRSQSRVAKTTSRLPRVGIPTPSTIVSRTQQRTIIAWEELQGYSCPSQGQLYSSEL